MPNLNRFHEPTDFRSENRKRKTRRERFLADMNRGVPWGPLAELIAPVYPKAAGAGQVEHAFLVLKMRFNRVMNPDRSEFP